MSDMIVRKQGAKNEDWFYLKQFSNMMRGFGFDLISCSGANAAIDFMLSAMSMDALKEIKAFTDNIFYTKGENERFAMAGFLDREDIKVRINEEIFRRNVYAIEKDSQLGSMVTSKSRKRLP